VPKPPPKIKEIKGRVRYLFEFEGFEHNEARFFLTFPKWLEGMQPDQQDVSSTARSSTDPAPQVPEPVIDNTNNTLKPSLVPEPWPSAYYSTLVMDQEVSTLSTPLSEGQV